jgi:hypothetical protein
VHFQGEMQPRPVIEERRKMKPKEVFWLSDLFDFFVSLSPGSELQADTIPRPHKIKSQLNLRNLCSLLSAVAAAVRALSNFYCKHQLCNMLILSPCGSTSRKTT